MLLRNLIISIMLFTLITGGCSLSSFLPDIVDPIVQIDTVYVSVPVIQTVIVHDTLYIPTYITIHDTTIITDTIYITQVDTIWLYEPVQASAIVSWNLVNQVDGYMIYCGKDSLDIILHDIMEKDDHYTVDSLFVDTLYYFGVKAFNRRGTSPMSDIIPFTLRRN